MRPHLATATAIVGSRRSANGAGCCPRRRSANGAATSSIRMCYVYSFAVVLNSMWAQKMPYIGKGFNPLQLLLKVSQPSIRARI